MKILLVIENIAERHRILRQHQAGPAPLIARSAEDAFDYISQFPFELVVCDLVFGNVLAREFVNRANEFGQPPPHFLCLLPNRSLNPTEVSSLRSIQGADGVDVMKKSDVELGLSSYLEGLSRRDETTPALIDSAVAMHLERAEVASGDLTTESANPGKLQAQLSCLDEKHEELASSVSQLRERMDAVDAQIADMEFRLKSLDAVTDGI